MTTQWDIAVLCNAVSANAKQHLDSVVVCSRNVRSAYKCVKRSSGLCCGASLKTPRSAAHSPIQPAHSDNIFENRIIIDDISKIYLLGPHRCFFSGGSLGKIWMQL